MGRRQEQRVIRPATTVEGRENQLISLATDLAQQQLQDGSASAQVLTHFLKLGTTREQLEQQRIQQENLLLSARVEQIQSQKRVEDLYSEALSAFKIYRGDQEVEGEEYYEDEY